MINFYRRKKAPVILQLSNTECGIAALAMLFAFYKVNIPIEELRDQCGATRDGCNVQTLIDVATRYGFEASAYSVDAETVRKLTEPVIAHWKFSHFVVINHIRNHKVSINDPAYGTLDVDWSDFDRSFTGVIININPTKAIVPNSKRAPTAVKIFRTWLSDFYTEIGFLLSCLIITIFTPYLNSRLYSFFIDQFVLSKNNYLMLPVFIASTLLSFVYITTSYFSKCIDFRLNIKASLIKSSRIILHTLKLPMLFYALRQRSEIISVIARTESITHLLINHSFKMITSFITGFICLLLMIKIDNFLSFFSILSTIAFISVFLLLSKITFNYEKTHVNIYGKLYAHTTSSMHNIETIRACSLEEKIIETWQNLFNKKLAAKNKIHKIESLAFTLMNSYNLFFLILILCVGLHRILHDAMTTSNLISYYFLNIFFNTSVISAVKCLMDAQSIFAQHLRINDILLYKEDLRFAHKKNNPFLTLDNNIVISCNHLSFYYNVNIAPTLDKISFKIERNEHVAFIGNTGSGKSTLIKLLCGLYQPNHGEINLQGHSLSTYSATELATQLAYVSQEVTLFSGTILQNLTLWHEHISLEDVYHAIETACLSKLIAERGLHSLVEESGKNFSTGEKQRLEIARALLQNTPILILDEATSALDKQTQKKLINNLRRLNKTIIFVAHRLSTIKHCDQIFTLSNGKIIYHEKKLS